MSSRLSRKVHEKSSQVDLPELLVNLTAAVRIKRIVNNLSIQGDPKLHRNVSILPDFFFFLLFFFRGRIGDRLCLGGEDEGEGECRWSGWNFWQGS